MHTLYIFYSAFFNICCLRSGPQHLPISSVLLWFTLLTYTFINCILQWLLGSSLFEATLISIMGSFLVMMLTGALLYITHHLARFTQTLTAWAGANTLMGIFSLLPTYWFSKAPHNVLLQLLLLSLNIWSITISAHVFRHTLGVSLLIGLILTIINSLLIVSVLDQIFPMNLAQ